MAKLKQNRHLLVLVLAVFMGLLASILSIRFLAQEPDVATVGTTTEVVIASRALAPGEVIGAADLNSIALVAETLPAGVVTSMEPLLGRTVLEPIPSGSLVQLASLAPQGAGAGLAGIIPDGMRAISLRVDEVVGVNGFVLPGMRVDVVTVVQNEGADPLSRILLEDVEVVAVGQQLESQDSPTTITATVVTLLVTPSELERLTLATAQGRIWLALRNRLDREERGTGAVRLSDIAGAARRAAPGGETASPGSPARPRAASEPPQPSQEVVVRNVLPEPGEQTVEGDASTGEATEAPQRPAVRVQVPPVPAGASSSQRAIEVINGTERSWVVY